MMEVMSDRIEELEQSNSIGKQLVNQLESQNSALIQEITQLKGLIVLLSKTEESSEKSLESLFTKFERKRVEEAAKDPETLFNLVKQLKEENLNLEQMIEKISLETKKLCEGN